MIFNEITKGGGAYVGYDYKTIIIDSGKTSMYIDAYANFGWKPNDSISVRPFARLVTLKLKRDRKIINKIELTRLQHHFESCMDEIDALENSKSRAATIYSLIIGLIGSAFLSYSIYKVINEPPNILLCVIFGTSGLFCCVFPCFLFKILTKNRTTEIVPLIEKKYDEIHEICEKGSELIHK